MLSRANELVQNILGEGKEGLLNLGLIFEIQKTFPGIKNI